MANKHPTTSAELIKRIKLARRDIGDLCFHFTRGKPADSETASFYQSLGLTVPDASAAQVLGSILGEGKLLGSTKWSQGMPVVCFTEAPIGEFTRLFELSKIASTSDQRVRYEPYGVAVSKSWLYAQGGRPVIYDATAVLELLPPALRYRFVSYSPDADDDVSWEREWRVHTQELSLDPAHTLVIVPTANEAFEIAYGGATIEPSHDEDGQVDGVLHSPRWLVASLDVFK